MTCPCSGCQSGKTIKAYIQIDEQGKGRALSSALGYSRREWRTVRHDSGYLMRRKIAKKGYQEARRALGLTQRDPIRQDAE